jgi:predicted DNA-binding protein (MmcQ/YjbR family)
MAHPQMFDDNDPVLARVRKLAFAFPSAAEKVSHGRPAFFTKKVFAYYGAAIRIDGEWVQFPQSIVLAADPEDSTALLQQKNCFVPAYFGPSGWFGLNLSAKKVDWAEVAELLDASYRLTAAPKLIAQLDR